MQPRAGFITSDLANTRAFYERVLGFEVKFGSDWYIFMAHPEGGMTGVSFMQSGDPRHDHQPIFQSPCQASGVFLSIPVKDVDQEYARICALDVPMVVELRNEAWNDRHFTLLDPNGVAIDIFQWFPRGIPEPPRG